MNTYIYIYICEIAVIFSAMSAVYIGLYTAFMYLQCNMKKNGFYITFPRIPNKIVTIVYSSVRCDEYTTYTDVNLHKPRNKTGSTTIVSSCFPRGITVRKYFCVFTELKSENFFTNKLEVRVPVFVSCT